MQAGSSFNRGIKTNSYLITALILIITFVIKYQSLLSGGFFQSRAVSSASSVSHSFPPRVSGLSSRTSVSSGNLVGSNSSLLPLHSYLHIPRADALNSDGPCNRFLSEDGEHLLQCTSKRGYTSSVSKIILFSTLHLVCTLSFRCPLSRALYISILLLCIVVNECPDFIRVKLFYDVSS